MASLSDIQALADKIVHEFHPEKIILFGSHARGDARTDSVEEAIAHIRSKTIEPFGLKRVARIRRHFPWLGERGLPRTLCVGGTSSVSSGK